MKNSLLLIFLFAFSFSNAQIKFSNSGFEGPPISGTPPPQWDSCSQTPDTNPNSSCCPWYIPAFEGETYVGLQTDSSLFSEYHESIGQTISCNLIEEHNCSFNLMMYEINTVIYPSYRDGAILLLYGGFSECEMDTLLWQSPSLDSVWHQYTATFVPHKPYNYLTFLVNNFNQYTGIGSKNSYIGVDALSEITV